MVTIRSSNCGAKFKKVGNLKAILISSLYQYPEANLYQSEMHPDGFQFTIPNPDLNSVSISWSKSVSVCNASWWAPINHSKSWFEICKHILKQMCISILIPDKINLHDLIESNPNLIKMVQDPDKICIQTRNLEFCSGLEQLLTWLKVLNILKARARDPDAFFDTDKKITWFEFCATVTRPDRHHSWY